MKKNEMDLYQEPSIKLVKIECENILTDSITNPSADTEGVEDTTGNW